MRKKHPLVCLLALLLLAGCNDRNPDDPASSMEASAVAETTAVTTDTTTADTTTSAATETVTTTTTAAATAAATTAKQTTPPAATILKATGAVEVYAGATLGDLIQQPGVQLKDAGRVLDTGKVGRFEVPVSYTYAGQDHTETFCYQVRDTTKPILLNGGYKTTLKKGAAFDIQKYVGYADNYDRQPKLTCTGTVNTNAVGSYPLTATVTDASGNQLRWELTVNVVEQLPKTTDTAARLPFASFAAQYGGGGRKLGIDVSKWQGNIDFQAVKNAGCSFVIMRIGHSRNGIEMDEYYKANIAAAKAAGLEVGVYFYSTANNETAVRTQANWIADQLQGQKLDFPVAFDWESFTNFQQYGMSIYDLNHLMDVFADEMGKRGYSTMLYSSRNFLNNFWTKQSSYPVWLAHYTAQTDYAGSYAIWQMSCRGRIPGIAGDVDLNILYPGKL